MKFVALFMCALMAVIVFPPAYFLGNINIAYADPIDGGNGSGTAPTVLTTTVSSGELPNPPGVDPIVVHSSEPTTAQSKPPVSDLSKLAATATAGALVSAFAFTLPGTTQVGDWSDPRTKTPPPPPGNPYLCSSPGNYTLDAQLDSENAFAVDVQPLYQSGDQITVFGDVFAKSSTCKGMMLTCSEQKAQACKVDKKLFG